MKVTLCCPLCADHSYVFSSDLPSLKEASPLYLKAVLDSTLPKNAATPLATNPSFFLLKYAPLLAMLH